MFIDRLDAARQLIPHIIHLKKKINTIVLAIPRGGLPIAAAIAHELHAPLDIILTKKIGAPYNEEFAIGAATPAAFFLDSHYLDSQYPADPEFIKNKVQEIQELLKKRAQLYRHGAPASELANKTVIIVDDGVATGQTMYAAVLDIKKQHPHEIIVVTPVISPEARELLKQETDEIISVIMPSDLGAIGAYYRNFEQVSDKEAAHILQSFKQGKYNI